MSDDLGIELRKTRPGEPRKGLKNSLINTISRQRYGEEDKVK